jgi:hypothetical protein
MLVLFVSDLGALENYTGTPFLPSDSDILLDSPDHDDIGKIFSAIISWFAYITRGLYLLLCTPSKV